MAKAGKVDTISLSAQQKFSLQDFKAFYYEFNAKPDTELKCFNESRIIEFGDLKDLNDKINIKLANNELASSLVTVKIALSDKKVLDFSTWKEFIDTKWDFAAHITHIEMQWDFYIILPHYKLPQRHTLKLRFGTEVKPSEYFQLVMSSDSDIDDEKIRAKVVCKVDYINAVISTELINLVSEWYESLPKIVEQNKLIVFMTKHERLITLAVHPTFNIAGVLIGLGILRVLLLFKIYSSSGSSILDLGISLSILWISVYIMGYLGQILYLHLHSHFDKISYISMFKITRGDKNIIRERSKKNNGILIKIITESISGLIVNILLILLHILTKF